MEILQFKAKIKLYSTINGGRTKPILTGYKPKLVFGITRPISNLYYNSDCVLRLSDREKAQPGEELEVVFGVLFKEHLDKVLLSKGIFFDIKEGSKTIGEGQIMQIIGSRQWEA